MLSVFVVAIVMVYTWLLAPNLPRSAAAVPVLLVIGIALYRAFRVGEWGFSTPALVPAVWRTAALTGTAVLAIYLTGVRLSTWHNPRDGWSRLAFLFPWALGQQFVLQTVFLREAQQRMPASAAILLAALAFAALHLPNPFLVAATFIGALAWCSVYARHPNVLPLALSHAVTTLAILYAFDNEMIGGLRIGAAYLSRR